MSKELFVSEIVKGFTKGILQGQQMKQQRQSADADRALRSRALDIQENRQQPKGASDLTYQDLSKMDPAKQQQALDLQKKFKIASAGGIREGSQPKEIQIMREMEKIETEISQLEESGDIAGAAKKKVMLNQLKSSVSEKKEKMTFEKYKNMTEEERALHSKYKGAGKQGVQKVTFEVWNKWDDAKKKAYTEFMKSGKLAKSGSDELTFEGYRKLDKKGKIDYLRSKGRKLTKDELGEMTYKSFSKMTEKGKKDWMIWANAAKGQETPTRSEAIKIVGKKSLKKYESELRMKEKKQFLKSKGAKPSVAEAAIDRAFAKTYASFVIEGGEAKALEGATELKKAANDIEKLEPNRYAGFLPDVARKAFTRESYDIEQNIYRNIQQTLRQTLGHQFTEKEGTMLFQRTYDPTGDPKENARRARNLATQLEFMLEAKRKAVEYYNEHGTLKGYSGKTSFSMGDLKPNVDMEPLTVDKLYSKNIESGIQAVMSAKGINREMAVKLLKKAGKL